MLRAFNRSRSAYRCVRPMRGFMACYEIKRPANLWIWSVGRFRVVLGAAYSRMRCVKVLPSKMPKLWDPSLGMATLPGLKSHTPE